MKQILILRTKFQDGKSVRKGKLIAQGAHASVSAVFDGLSRPETKKHVEDWFKYGQAKIAVYVHSEDELLDLWEKIQASGLASSIIRDSGKTEFGGVPTLTAIAVGPAPSELIDPITRHLPLL